MRAQRHPMQAVDERGGRRLLPESFFLRQRSLQISIGMRNWEEGRRQEPPAADARLCYTLVEHLLRVHQYSSVN